MNDVLMLPWWVVLIAIWQSVGLTLVVIAFERGPVRRQDWPFLVTIWLLWPVLVIGWASGE